MEHLFELNRHLLVFILASAGLLVAYLLLVNTEKKDIISAGNDGNQLAIVKRNFRISVAALLIVLGTSVSTLWNDQQQSWNDQQQLIKNLNKAVDDSTSKIRESEALRRRSDSLLSAVGISLKKSDSILKDQRTELTTTSELLTRHIQTNRYILGSSGIPKLILRISDNKTSFQYKVLLFIQNNDNYPFHNLEFYHRDIDEVNKALKGWEGLPFDTVMLRYDKVLFGDYKKLGPFILPKGPGKTVLTTSYDIFKERAIFKNREYYECQIQWSTGYCHVSFALSLKDLIPTVGEITIISEKGVTTLKEYKETPYFKFDNQITSETVDSIKARREEYKNIDIRRKLISN